jgi:hypothetical protein
MARIGRLFRRSSEDVPYAGVLTQWSVCRDVGGTYYRGVIRHDFLGRFKDGERMSTGYVNGDPVQGAIRAGDGYYELAPSYAAEGAAAE